MGGFSLSYAPLDSDILFSTTIKEGPVVFAVWCAILASKDQDGVTALNPESLALLMSNPEKGLVASLEEIQAAWKTLAAPDLKSRNQEHGGRRIIPTEDGRWIVVSHEKYRVKHQKLHRQEQLRFAKQRQREREKAEKSEAGSGAPPEDRCEVCGEAAEVAVAGARFCVNHASTWTGYPAVADDEVPI